jgi:hypothetical protein
MSYVATRIGHGMAGLWASGSEGTFQCKGGEFKSLTTGETARQEGCCSDTTWTEATYRAIKGDSSTQRYLENRIHEACGYMTAEWIDNVGWDVPPDAPDTLVSPMLISRAAKAAQNFKDLFQPDRWFRNAQGIETDCVSSGYYATWEDRGILRPDVQQAAIKRILGSSYTPEQLAGLTAKLKAVVWGVPRDSWMSYAQPGLTEKDLFVVQNGQVVPTAWMTSFLNAFSPMAAKQTMMTASVKIKKPIAKKPDQAQRLAENQRRAILEEQGTAGSSVAPYVALGASAVALAGVYLYFKFGK